MQYSAITAFVTSILVIAVYFFYRHYLLNDFLGLVMATTVLRGIFIPSFKIVTIMLVSLFLFDVFWVFISPYFFGSSVMVFAAT